MSVIAPADAGYHRAMNLTPFGKVLFMVLGVVLCIAVPLVVWFVIARRREEKLLDAAAASPPKPDPSVPPSARPQPSRGRAAGGHPDAAAAGILRGLLAGDVTPAQARRTWPQGVSEPNARSYIDYFEERHSASGQPAMPGFDQVVENLASQLERSASR